jgi:hypothetical protein
MPLYGYEDAAMTNGFTFKIGIRRKTGLFGLFDDPPLQTGSTITHDHIAARRRWPKGEIGRQISWSSHGQVQVLSLSDGRNIAVWIDEIWADPAQRERLRQSVS